MGSKPGRELFGLALNFKPNDGYIFMDILKVLLERIKNRNSKETFLRSFDNFLQVIKSVHETINYAMIALQNNYFYS